MVFVFLCLTSLSMIISRSIYIVANGIILFFFIAKYYFIPYMYYIFFIQSYYTRVSKTQLHRHILKGPREFLSFSRANTVFKFIKWTYFFINKNNTKHIKYTSFLKKHVVSRLERPSEIIQLISASMYSWAIAEEGYNFLRSKKTVKPEM